MDLDDFFSDDGLDDLPDNALQELENRALHSTQAPRPAPPLARPQQQQQPTLAPSKQRRSLEYSWDDEDDLDTTEVTDDAGLPLRRPVLGQALPASQQRPRQETSALPAAPARRPIPPPPNPKWNPNLSVANRNAGGFPNSQAQAMHPGRPHPSQMARPPPASSHRFAGSSQVLPLQTAPNSAVAALQQRLRILEEELNVARGEASILRQNASKAEQQHEAEVNRLRKINADQLSKHERIAQAAVAAEKSANTELQFLQSDIREENVRRKRQQTGPPVGEDKGAVDSTKTTPKKALRTWGMADGFMEMDMAISPSKGGRRANTGAVASNIGERTPSKNKRKRPVNDSPVLALETHTEDVPMQSEPRRALSPSFQQTAAPPIASPASSYEYLHLVLDHADSYSLPSTFEALAKLSFPSEPDKTLSTLIFERLPGMGHPARPMQLMVDLSFFLTSLWRRSLDEEFWEPIRHIISLLSFTLWLNTTSVSPGIMLHLTIVAQETAELLGQARYHSATGILLPENPRLEMERNIDTTEILSLLYHIAAACTGPYAAAEGFSTPITEFWRTVTVNFALLLLSPKQKPQDILGMLSLLATSALPDSLGPISADKDSVFVAGFIIERVSANLTEPARPSTTAAERRQIRLAALATLIAFTAHPFGALQLAHHDKALPRLVTCLSLAIDSLYDISTLPTVLPESQAEPQSHFDRKPRHEFIELNQIISHSVLLIHTLVTGPHTANVAEISAKLSVTLGGSQRYLIALGRLSFAEEDLVLERGIESEVVEMAHELLELVVTPEEGTMVSEAFGVV